MSTQAPFTPIPNPRLEELIEDNEHRQQAFKDSFGGECSALAETRALLEEVKRGRLREVA